MSASLSAKLAVSRAVAALSRMRGGGATSAPGRVLLRLQPTAIEQLAALLARGSALISATNGKTTTAAIAAEILRREGIPLVHNKAGANMAGGIATALLDAAHGGGIDGEFGLFEVDELWLGRLAERLHPRAIVLCNLFRDQLDRYGELERIADSWHELLAASDAQLVLNADDPMVADLGRDHPRALYFGIEDDSLALAGMAHAADAKHCRRCGAPYRFDAVYLGHLGRYRCDSCGQRRPDPALSATDVQLEGVRGVRFTLRAGDREHPVELALPGLYNVYNALAASALAVSLGVELEHVAGALAGVRAAFGRGERVMLAPRRAPGAGGAAELLPARELRILLVKNPAGANEVLRTLSLEPGEHDLLGVLNDQIADGRDVSWIWDADFEQLAGRVRRFTCSGSRAADLALRLKYAGIDPERIVLEYDLPRALERAAADRPQADAPLYALPTYTAMLALRSLLLARGEELRAWN